VPKVKGIKILISTFNFQLHTSLPNALRLTPFLLLTPYSLLLTPYSLLLAPCSLLLAPPAH